MGSKRLLCTSSGMTPGLRWETSLFYISIPPSHSHTLLQWDGKAVDRELDQGADLAEKQSDKICDFCYFVWTSFSFFLRAETQTAVMAPPQAQEGTQLTLVLSFIPRTAI